MWNILNFDFSPLKRSQRCIQTQTQTQKHSQLRTNTICIVLCCVYTQRPTQKSAIFRTMPKHIRNFIFVYFAFKFIYARMNVAKFPVITGEKRRDFTLEIIIKIPPRTFISVVSTMRSLFILLSITVNFKSNKLPWVPHSTLVIYSNSFEMLAIHKTVKSWIHR